ncbi:type II secretion system inner membrane protein GspF [Hyphomonas sp.]|uniref:type II secretion system inner membrane protein GspF n=1 Tax=Hyphomonas sp. TaxID=87 RepID=UPI00391A4ABA
MAAYEYRALTADGRRTSGVISADSPRAARQELRARQLTPVDVSEASDRKQGPSRSAGRMSHKQRTLFTRQLAVLLQSGMTVEQALAAAASDSSLPRVRSTVMGVRQMVMEGATLADALKSAPAAFPPLYRSVVAAGESAGKLPGVLEQLSASLERTYKMTSTAQAALVYPAVLGLMALAMVSALMVFVVPKLVEQFAMLGTSELPALTEFVIGTSTFLRDWGLALILAIALTVFLFARALKSPAFKRRWDGFVLKLPLIGPLLRTLSASRFARVHATLAGSGATVLEALSAAGGAMSNLIFRDAAMSIRAAVQEGGTLSAAMKATGVFPPMMTHMVQSGEVARNVPDMMNRAAEFLESEFEATTRTALSLLEPAIIILLGGIVGTIVLSIMLPIMQLNTLALG